MVLDEMLKRVDLELKWVDLELLVLDEVLKRVDLPLFLLDGMELMCSPLLPPRVQSRPLLWGSLSR